MTRIIFKKSPPKISFALYLGNVGDLTPDLIYVFEISIQLLKLPKALKYKLRPRPQTLIKLILCLALL